MNPEYYIFLSGPSDNTIKVADPQGNFLGNIVTGRFRGLYGTDGLEITANGDLLVGTVLDENILRYDGQTGTFLGEFASSNSGGFHDPDRQTGLGTVTDIKIGPDGNLYVSNFVSFFGFNPVNKEPIFSTNPQETTDNVLVFDPDGNFITQYDFSIEGPAIPLGIEFIGNKLLVATREHDIVYQFEDITSADLTQPNLLTPFIDGSAPNTPLDGPADVLLASDGLLYVTSLDSQQIQRYNPDGSFVDIFLDQTDEQGLIGPTAIVEVPSEFTTPSGQPELIVTAFESVNAGRINFDDGSPIDVFIPVGGNSIWGFAKNMGAKIVTPEMIGGPPIFPDVPEYYILLSGPTDNTVKVADPEGNFLGNLVVSNPNLNGGLVGTDGLEITVNGDLLVGAVLSKNVLRYAGNTGAFIDEFIATGSGGFFNPNTQTGLDTVTQIKFGPDGNLYISNFIAFDGFDPATREPFLSTDPTQNVDNVLVFDPNGNFLTQYDFPSAGPEVPLGIEFVGNKLLVVSRVDNAIYKFDDITSADLTKPNKLTPFIDGNDPNIPLNGPAGLLVASDGNLYVSSLDSQQIQRYNANDGSFIDIFVDKTNEKGITGPSALLETPNGQELIVTGFSSLNAARIDFEGEDAGTVIDVFIPAGGNETWGFGKNEGAKIVTPDMIGGPIVFQTNTELTDKSLFVSNVNNTFGVGPVVNIGLDENGNLDSVSPNFEPGVYYSSILEYDGNNGDFIGAFVPQGSASQDGIFLSSGITFKDNILYANDQGFQNDPTVTNPADSLYGRILKYDATTGEFLGEFISGKELTSNGLNFPEDLLFGPDGDLYVSGLGGGGVQKFDGTTGDYEETIIGINPFTGKDLIAAGLNFGPDGNLYISSVLNDNSIIRYNTVTKEVDQFIPPEIAPAIPSGSTFTPDGVVFVNGTFVSVDPSLPVNVKQYDPVTGKDERFFVNPFDNGGLTSASRMIFDENFNFYVSDFNASQIVSFNSNGVPRNGGVFIGGDDNAELRNPGGLAFYPASQKNYSEISPSPMYRFKNTSFSTGAYLFVGEEEKNSILANPDYNKTFKLEGDGNPAFQVSLTPENDLTGFYRLRSDELQGTYLFVGQEEYNSIFSANSNQKNKWIKEGLDSNGNDIADFYAYSAGADKGLPFNRFQNENSGYLFAGVEETTSILNNPSFANAFTNQGAAFEGLA